MHDLVVRNGTIVDGNGGEPFEGDVAIDGALEGLAAVAVDNRSGAHHEVVPGIS